MGKRQGVTYRDLKKNKTNKKKQEEPKREPKKAIKKVDRKSAAPKNERAGVANRAGAKENLYNAGSSIKSAYKKNLAESQKNKSKVASSSWGQVASKAADTQENRAQARKAFKKNTTGKGAQTAYKTGEKARENYQKAGEKTVHTKSPLTIQAQTAVEGVRNLTQQVSQANKFYDKNEKKAQKEGMTYGDKKEFIRRWATDPSNKKYLDNYKKNLKEDSTYKYTKSGKDTDTFFQEAVASNPAFAYQKVKTETDVPVYLRDKDGNIKYDKDGKPRVKTDKNGDTVYQKVDTTLGNNILNAKAGGFDKNGRLTSMEGSEQMGNQTAGALRDAKFFGGLLQGTSYGDITKGLGTYSNAAARDLDKTTQSGAFNAGYGIGIMAQFGLSGINSMGKALLKEGMKSVPKTIAKTAGLSAALDTPLNVADAVKMGTDARGNINPAAVGMYFGINTLMSGLLPAGIEGLGAGVTRAQSKELLNLLAREEKLVQAGKTLSPQDAMRRDELFAKQAKTAEGQVSAAGVIAGKTLDDIAGKGGNPTVNAIRAKVQVDPKKALGKVSENNPTTDDLITIGAVKDISRKRGDYKTAAEAELKLRKMRDGLDPEMKKQVDAIMKQVDSTRKIEAANIFKEADAKEIVSRADEGKSVTSRVLTELEGAVEYARQTGDSKLLSDAETALKQAQAENKKLIEGINKQYKQLGDKLKIPIKANTKAELDNILRANGNEVPAGEYGGFVLRNADGSVKEIYVNADAPDAVSFTVGHEIAHVMEAAGEDYSALRNLLKEYDGGKLWDEEASKVVDLYAGVKNAKIENEITANTLGRLLTSEGERFLDDMFKQDRTLFEKLYDFIRKLLNGGETQSKELTEIEDKMRKILDGGGGNTLRDEEFGDGIVDFAMREGITDQGFYSKARVAVEKLGKDAKVRENDFIRYLKKAKNGVSDEEIKWLGIRTAFEENGGNPMTKQELLDWIDANRLVLKEKTRGKGSKPNPIKISIERNAADDYVLAVKNEDGELMEYQWLGEDEDVAWDNVWMHLEQEYNVRDAQKYAYDLFENGKNEVDVKDATTVENATKWGGYALRDGSNYREYEYVLPNSSYTNDAMLTHWGDEGVVLHTRAQDFSFYSQKNDVEFNGKVLFIDEIQSDWHNEGAKYGYGTHSIDEIGEAKDYLWDTDLRQGELSRKLTDMLLDGKANTEQYRKLKAEYEEISARRDEINAMLSQAPDAPYRNNYTDYAMKRMLLEAIQNDQDYIAWTTAKQQAERWSNKYMKGYEIEYDQEIPSFMSKYCKQWGADVEKITLAENGEEVWAVRINDAMKKSVLEDGQADFMMIGTSAREGVAGIRKTNTSTGKITKETIKLSYDALDHPKTGAKAVLERRIESAIEAGASREELARIHDEVRRKTGWVMGADGNWGFEINDSPARFGFKLTPRGKAFDKDTEVPKIAALETEILDPNTSPRRRSQLIKQKEDLDRAWGTHGLYTEEGAPLNEFLVHPELYKAYLGFKKSKVRMRFDVGNLKISRDSNGEIKGLSCTAGESGSYLGRHHKGNLSLNANILKVPEGETIEDYARALRVEAARRYGLEIPRPEDFEGMSKKELLEICDERGIELKGKVKRNGKTITLNRKTATEADLINRLAVKDEDVPQEFLRGTTLHEIQHRVQAKEGWAGGGMQKTWQKKQRLYDDKGNVVKEYFTNDLTIAKDPKDQKVLNKNRAKMKQSFEKYGDLAIDEDSVIDGSTLRYIEYAIGKEFPKQVRELLDSNKADEYVNLMMEEMPSVCMRERLIPFDGVFPPETQALDTAMRKYFKDSFETRKYAETSDNVYGGLIGEQQSRMTQRRSRMTPKERAETPVLDADATYRYGDLEAQGQPVPIDIPKYQSTFNRKYPNTRVDESGKIDFGRVWKDPNEKKKASFSILDTSDKLKAQKETRAKEQADIIKRVRETIAKEAKEASQYGKDTTKHPVKEKAIMDAFNKAYDERTGVVKWGEVYKALAKDTNFNPKMAKSIRNRLKRAFEGETVTTTKVKKTVESPDEFKADVEETRVPENEMSDEEFFRGLEAPEEESSVEANWNEAVPAKATKTNEKLLAKEDVASVKSLVDELETAQKKLPKATTAEKRMAIEKEISSLDAKINSEIESIGDKKLERYYNLRKSLGNASTDEERAALKEEIAHIEQGEVAEPPKPAKPKPAEKPAKPEAKPEKPSKEKMEKAQATLDKQMEYYAEAEDALAKATTPEEIKLAKQRLGLAKGRVQKASNAIDVLNGTKPAKAKADVTPLPKGESLPEPPAGRAQELKEEMPNLETILKNAKEGWISKHELGEHAKHLGEYWSEEAEATDAAFKNAVKNKELGGKVGRDIPYNEAFKKASEDVEKDLGKVYDRVMSRDNFIVETTQSAADKHALLMKLVEKAGEGGENAETYAMMHLKVIDKMDEAASLGGHMLQLQSYILRNSPEGRVRWVAREIARLSKEYQKHLKGKQIEISPEQIKKILEAKSEKAVAEVMEDTGKMIWKQIPAGFFESANQIRHFSMLFNPKTHARNIVGNSVFLGARTLSDVIEVGMTKLFNRRLQNLSPIDQYEAVLKDLREQQKGATPKQKQELGYKIRETNKLLAEAKADANSPMRQYLAIGEVSGCKKILDERFDLDYKTNGGQSTGKFQEGRRSAGYLYEQSGNKVKDTLAKGTNKMIDLNYWLLDQEDKLYFRPAYERAYVRWCKSRGLVEKVGNTNMVTPKALEKMSKTDLQEATAYAMQQAKIATFRDDSAISDRIIQWKRATEGKKGTGLGTVGYRTLNVGLESVLPFVKTPVNILRRGMDYSPIGMFRGLADSILAKDPQTFMRGIHEMSAGLTGTGIAILGMWAASHDWVTVHTGEVSGDEYYDRDMGFQDFSVLPKRFFDHFNIKVFDEDFSASLDWMAPVQLAFFQGAAVYKDLCERKGISMETALNALEAGVMPMLEMSFLSSAKDTVTSFMERAYRDGTGNEANAAQAIGRTLFGTLPQDWLSGFVPQLLSQFAGASDEYQRDTSSTKEDELARSWESFGRKMQNRLPHFRESLQPKVNRRGEEVKVEGSDNIMAKIFNSFANPANVKKITLDKYDRAVIDVLGDEELDEDKKKYIPLDLTGNPSYDRGEDFARMTYTEKHDYLVSKRADQWQNWKSAVDSKSFKDMTTKMKADELTDYHFLGQIKADKDVYGVKYAAKKIVEKGSKEADLWKNIKYFGGNAKDFVDSYVAIEKLSARSHKNDYHTKALAIRAMDTSEKKKDLIGKAYDIYGDKLEPAKTFLSKYKDATKALADYTNAFCSGESVCEKAGVSDSKKNMSLALANVDGGVPEKVYRAGGYDWNSAQAGGGLKKYGYTYDSLAQMKSDALMKADTDNNNSLKKAEVIDYIESLGIEDNDEKACLFEYLKSGSAKNPYGTIKDHLEWNSTPDTTGSGGGRRGYGRRRGRGGGGSGGGRGIGWEAWLKKQGLAQASKAGGNSRRVSDNTSKSALDEAYRKKLSKNIRATSKKH